MPQTRCHFPPSDPRRLIGFLAILVLPAGVLAGACTLEDRGTAAVAVARTDAPVVRDARGGDPRDARGADGPPPAAEAGAPAASGDGASGSGGATGGVATTGTDGAATTDVVPANDAGAGGGGGGFPDTAGPANPVVTPPAAPGAPAGCPADPDLALCLRFEGGVRDESPRHLAVESNNLRFVPGPTGLVGALDPRSRVLVPEVPDLDATTITVEASVNASSLETRMTVLENPGQYGLFILPSGNAMCSGNGGYALGNAVSVGRWVHLLCTFDGASIVLWVDGQRRAQGPALPVATDRTKGTRIGWDDDPPNEFVGLIDDLRVWRTIRAPAPP